MLQKLLKQSFVISNNKVDIDCKVINSTNYDDFFITTFNGGNLKDKNKVQIDFNTMEWIDSSVPINYGVTISNNKLSLKNNDMNTREIYCIYEPDKNLFVLFNNLILAKQILKSCNLPIEYSSDKNFENGSFFKHIKLITFAENFNVEIINKQLHLSGQKPIDIIEETNIDKNLSIEQAEESFYNALYNATKELTKSHNDITISLSGGLDSATVACILTKLNKNISAYTVGTEWGDEYDSASETARYLNINLNKLAFTKDEIIKQIPNVIAFFAFTHPNNIEISLVAQCLYNKITKNNKQNKTMFATGFGSDIINAGLFTPFNNYNELGNEIVTTLKNSRSSSELYGNIFSNNNALYYDINLVHPFWDSNVITNDLKCPPEYKVVNNQDKYFSG